MTDKQIIENKNGFYCIEPCSEIKQLKEQLKAKEQQCEKAKQNAQDTYDLWQALIESFNILQGEKIKLEQECEELKAENNTYKSSIVANLDKSISKRYRELLEENDKLKAENDELKQFLSKEPLAIQALQSAYSDYKKRSEVFFEMIGEYKQTLAEIKEIAEANKKYIYVLPNYSVAGDSLEFSFEFIKQILQKINEVENE